MANFLYRTLFRLTGSRSIYRHVVESDRLTNIRAGIRRDLQHLLEQVNRENPFFRNRFTDFLHHNRQADDDQFFTEYARLPSFSKQDYAAAGMQVMPDKYSEADPQEFELKFDGKPIRALRRLRRGDYLMPMPTGGSSSLPLVVYMTKRYMFAMLFTFFKCWYRMGWRPGQRMLIFYPKNTYNIDDMVKFNPLSKLSGFKYHLFEKIDRATVEKLVDDINHYRPKLLLVFPSPMNMIAHTIRQYHLPLRHQPELINVSGETFFDCQRANIQSVFDRSRIEDSYGSVELGEIAHETDGGLEVFANTAYVETERNEAGQPEMVVTRLGLTDFPFIRYRMKDIADVEFRTDDHGHQRFLLTRIEGKDSNYILSDQGKRFYPSFFNQLVNEINLQVADAIVEIKVYERNQRDLEIQLIVNDSHRREQIAPLIRDLLSQRMSPTMNFEVRFTDFIEHDYRRKYRVIERIGDIEFAGGIVGDNQKINTVREIESVN